MDAYAPKVERKMKRLFDSLRENDQRRYAAVEATKLGHGGIEYIAGVLQCDPKTIRRGLAELETEDDLDTNRVRKKGVDEESYSTSALPSSRTSSRCFRTTLPAIRCGPM
jgi:hypothetical protein